MRTQVQMFEKLSGQNHFVVLSESTCAFHVRVTIRSNEQYFDMHALKSNADPCQMACDL